MIERMDHVGIVVDDLAAATEFFVELGLELTKFHTPSSRDDNRHAPANTPGIRHVAFAAGRPATNQSDPTRVPHADPRAGGLLLREVGMAPAAAAWLLEPAVGDDELLPAISHHRAARKPDGPLGGPRNRQWEG